MLLKENLPSLMFNRTSGNDEFLLPQHDQRIGAVGHPPPLRVVVGFEAPGLTVLRHQQQLAALPAATLSAQTLRPRDRSAA